MFDSEPVTPPGTPTADHFTEIARRLKEIEDEKAAERERKPEE